MKSHSEVRIMAAISSVVGFYHVVLNLGFCQMILSMTSRRKILLTLLL